MTHPPSASPQPSPTTAPRPKTSGLAIASLVCGISGIVTCGVSAIAGLILGIVALSKIGKSGGKIGGRGLAIAGIVVSACMIVVGFLVTGMPFLLVLFRDEITDWVTDIWEDARGEAQDEQEDFFGDGQLYHLNLPLPRIRLTPRLLTQRLPCAG